MKAPTSDRFESLSDNYGNLFIEVFEEEGLDYHKLQKSVFASVLEIQRDIKNVSILDIGIGDGETSALFVEHGCKNLTGLDLNRTMLDASRKRFGNKIKLQIGNAVAMHCFKPDQFQVIITGMSIHNIPFLERKKFWKEILRLRPQLFVSAEKIADPNLKKHKKDYDNEIRAIKKIYGERYGLDSVVKEWIKHYEFDENEKLTLNEIEENIGHAYTIRVILEMGMCKTLLAERKAM